MRTVNVTALKTGLTFGSLISLPCVAPCEVCLILFGRNLESPDSDFAKLEPERIQDFLVVCGSAEDGLEPRDKKEKRFFRRFSGEGSFCVGGPAVITVPHSALFASCLPGGDVAQFEPELKLVAVALEKCCIGMMVALLMYNEDTM